MPDGQLRPGLVAWKHLGFRPLGHLQGCTVEVLLATVEVVPVHAECQFGLSCGTCDEFERAADLVDREPADPFLAERQASERCPPCLSLCKVFVPRRRT